MLTHGASTGGLAASTKLEKVRANQMSMKERLQIHREIEAENRRKLDEWKEGRK